MFCRKCGNKLEDDWIVCPSCGELQKQGDIQQTSPGPVKKWWIAAGAGIIFLVLIMALLGTLIMLGSQMPDNTDSGESGKTASKEAVKEEKTELTETADPKRKSKKKAASAKKAENGVAVDTAVQSKTAEEKTAEVLRSEYIFPDSSTRYLSEEEVRSKDASQLLIGRNEIFARYGYIFEMEELKTHFEGTSWYKGTVPGSQFNMETEFNDFEKKNAELIKRIENEMQGTTAAQQKELDYDGTQEAADKAYNFVAGRTFQAVDRQLAIEFGVSGEFVAIGYYGSAPLTNKYCTYYFSSEYEYSHDIWQYLVYVHIEGVKYQFRYFEDGSVSLDGQGEFDGWYGRR